MALVCSEIDTAKLFQRSLSSFWAEIEPHFTLKTERVAAHRDTAQLWLDLPELGEYFPVPVTQTNSSWPWFPVKWTQQNFLNAHF